MSYPQRSEYLEARVLTAPPHRLHLMLIDGAIRFGRQAEEALRRGDVAAADAPLVRVVEIVGELLAGVRGTKTELNKQIVEGYWFLFRRATEAKIHTDVEKLAEALRLLEYERQTWQLVSDKIAAESHDKATSDAGRAGPQPPIALGRHLRSTSSSSNSGLSLEA